MWEDPEIVALADCRYDAGVVVPDVQPAGEIGRMDFPPTTVAQVEIKGGIDLEMRCLDWLFRTWLPQSRYVPAELPAFEAWIGRPFAHGKDHFELHAQLPVVRG
jgi:AraC family transcriptional regulator